MPKLAVGDVEHKQLGNFGFPEVFLFLIAVNFWNFLVPEFWESSSIYQS